MESTSKKRYGRSFREYLESLSGPGKMGIAGIACVEMAGLDRFGEESSGMSWFRMLVSGEELDEFSRMLNDWSTTGSGAFKELLDQVKKVCHTEETPLTALMATSAVCFPGFDAPLEKAKAFAPLADAAHEAAIAPRTSQEINTAPGPILEKTHLPERSPGKLEL